jgi:hypothetical protein
VGTPKTTSNETSDVWTTVLRRRIVASFTLDTQPLTVFDRCVIRRGRSAVLEFRELDHLPLAIRQAENYFLPIT